MWPTAFFVQICKQAGLVSQGPTTAATAAAAVAAGRLLRGLRHGLGCSRHFSDSAADASHTAAAAAAAAAPAGSSQTGGQLPPGVFQQSCRVAGRLWTFETGRLAGLAHGSCLVTVEGTAVLGTAVVDPTPQPEADGVPLQVEYRERLSAAGRLPMRPDRRERVGSEREVLAARLIDRAVRPLLPPGFLYDTQVWVQVLSADGSIDPEVVGINAASAALLLAPNIPFSHPVGGVKVRWIRRKQDWQNDKLLVNSAVDAMHNSSSSRTNPSSSSSSGLALSLVYAGSPAKATAIEAAAEQTPEAVVIDALRKASASTASLISAQQALAAAAGGAQQPQQQQLPLLWPEQRLQQAVAQLAEQPLRDLFTRAGSSSSSSSSSSSGSSRNKESRAAALSAIQAELLRDLQRTGLLAEAGQAAAAAGQQVEREEALRALDVLQSRVMRDALLGSEEPRRVDGRGLRDLRPVSCQAGPLSRTVHGSGLFTRGETQSLATATVGHDTEVAPMESLWGRRVRSPLHLHYSFPPFSVGELGKQGAPNRREVGHGNLARAGVLGVMPREEDFPFSVRVTADTLSSSGSSSMAAVCAASLALRTAGVPTAALAAGVSVGLVTAGPPQLGAWSSQQQQQQQGARSSTGDGGGSVNASGYSSFVAVGLKPGDTSQPEGSGPEPAGGSSSSSSSSSDSEHEAGASSSDGSIAAAAAQATDSGAERQQVLSSSYGCALLLTDIQGIEDHLGDMDFKVAGTSAGITAMQLDTKLPGVDLSLLEAALAPAAAARQQILAAMDAAVKAFESGHSPIDLPQYGAVQIMKELVPRLIGPQGSTLTEIEEGCGASLIVDDGGTINVYAPTQLRYQHALASIQEVEGRGVVKGQVYRVRVVKIVDFGAYVTLPNGLPALLHISELSHEKIREARDVVAEGQEFDVVCKGRDSKGFVLLSLKDMQQQQQQGAAAAKGGTDRGGAAPSAASTLQEKLEAAVAAASGSGGGGSSSSGAGISRPAGQQQSRPARSVDTWRPSADQQRRQQQSPGGAGGEAQKDE